MQKAVHSGLPFVVQKMKIWRFIMADENMNTIHITEKQKVQEITDKLEEGLKELLRVKSTRLIFPLCQNFIINACSITKNKLKFLGNTEFSH